MLEIQKYRISKVARNATRDACDVQLGSRKYEIINDKLDHMNAKALHTTKYLFFNTRSTTTRNSVMQH
jgi:hypothetical protein